MGTVLEPLVHALRVEVVGARHLHKILFRLKGLQADAALLLLKITWSAGRRTRGRRTRDWECYYIYLWLRVANFSSAVARHADQQGPRAIGTSCRHQILIEAGRLARRSFFQGCLLHGNFQRAQVLIWLMMFQ